MLRRAALGALGLTGELVERIPDLLRLGYPEEEVLLSRCLVLEPYGIYALRDRKSVVRERV